MPAEDVKKFLERLQGDTGLQEKLQKAAVVEKPRSDAEASVRTILAEAGFDFTPKEFEAATRSLRKPSEELSDDDLEAVAGGVALQRMPVGGFFQKGGLLSHRTQLGKIFLGY